MKIAMIWAQDVNGAIGNDGEIPWYVPEDFARFKELTFGAPVIMGRATWESLPEKSRPLPGRTNIVLSRDQQWEAPGAVHASTPDEALTLAKEASTDQAWIIGGSQIYTQFLDNADWLEVTYVDTEIVQADAYAPVLGSQWHIVERVPHSGWRESRTGTRYAFAHYERA